MPELLCLGAVLKCSFGLAPSVFIATPLPGMPLMDGVLPSASMVDIIPMENILPFAMCNSPANPEVIAATAAALGVLTPMPCIPVPVTPWVPPSVITMGMGLPMATVESKCVCAWGGMIAVDVPVVSPGETE